MGNDFPSCKVCGNRFPWRSRSDKLTCSPRCRKALSRSLSFVRPDPGALRPIPKLNQKHRRGRKS